MNKENPMNPLFIAPLFAALFLFSVGFPTAARAYCVSNGTSVSVHGQSLDSQRFSRDIAPGAEVCCQHCGDGRPRAILLIVTGYVPVTRDSHPGWTAECRVRVASGGRVRVTGNASRITCEADSGG